MCSRETDAKATSLAGKVASAYDTIAAVDRAQQDRVHETTVTRLVREFTELPAGHQAAFMVLVNMRTQLTGYDREVCRLALHQNLHITR